MKTWIKMYTESLHDRKLWKLKPIEQLTFWYLCTLAGIEDRGGQLPEMDDIELELRMPLQLKRAELEKIITTLIGAGLITSDPETGTISVTNFEKRQMSSQTEAEKKALYRDRKRTASGQTSDECPTTESDTEEDNVRTRVRTDVREMSTVEEEVEEEEEEEEELIKSAQQQSRAKKRKEPRERGQLKPYGIGENVLLSEMEHAKLREKLGDRLDPLIEDLSIYLGKNPKYGEKYPDHYFDLLSWAKKDEKDREKAEAAPKPAPPQQPMTTYQRLKAMGEL